MVISHRQQDLRIADFVSGFRADERVYDDDLSTDGAVAQTRIFRKDECGLAAIDVKFYPDAGGSRVFIGKNLRGSVTVHVHFPNATIYIGDNCNFGRLVLRSRRPEDLIVIGNSVTSNGHVTMISGNCPAEAQPYIVVGDDCLFSYAVTFRNSDGHPIINAQTGEIVNNPRSGILLEPHVWVGQGVNVLKDTRVGACSILSFGCVVTRDVPFNHVARGIPSNATPLNGRVWARGPGEPSVRRAQHFYREFRDRN